MESAMGKKSHLPLFRTLLPALFCSLLLSACQKQAEDIGQRLGWVKKDQQQWIEGSNYYNFPEFTPGTQYKSESSFCYKMQTDILCYDQPRPGWEDRMVGYQEPLRAKGQYTPSPQPVGNAAAMIDPAVQASAPTTDAAPVAEVSVSANTPFATQTPIDSKDLAPLPSVTIQ